ncbi:hypothetical protein [Bradyrhizobium prioriisuperbiae]|uniref:hypothetical protein n=1 Tax=Bradyrhizobium prioriisuperbiae TaxID=2854389 RepID=UPI0028E46191|nr:hypothetical protein [Bradyrhizobium prioritasuperba]
MSDQGSNPPSNRPRAEPEIIPPGAPLPPHDRDGPFNARFQRIYIARPGPFGLLLVALAAIIIVAVILLLVVGAVLIWLPVVGLMIAIGIVTGLVRSRWRC